MPARRHPVAPPTRRPVTAVVGYVRISKDRADETSTTSQADAIRAYAASKGWAVVDVITEAGRSAYGDKGARRPGLARARRLVEAGAAQALVAWRLDRVARNARDALNLVHDLRAAGAHLVTVADSIDTSSTTGKVVLSVLAAVAELESDARSDRTVAWHRHRKAQAVAPSGLPPTGYVRPAPNVLAVDPVAGPAVAAAAKAVLGGASVRSQVAQLAVAGVRLSPQGLGKVLRSPTVAGLVDLGDRTYTPGTWPALVDPDDWHALVAKLDDPARRTNHTRGERRWPLAWIARCGTCGSTMNVRPTHPRGPRLTCTGDSCWVGIRYDHVDALVTAAVLDALDDDTWRLLRAAAGRDPDMRRDVIDAKLADLWTMVLAHELDVDDYRTAKARWEGELAAVATRTVDLPDVASVRAAWDDLDPDARHLVFRAVIDALVIDPAGVTRPGPDPSRVRLVLVP